MTLEELSQLYTETAASIKRLEAETAARFVDHNTKLRALEHLAEVTLDSIRGLERIAEAHQRQVEELTREWQAYLRRLPPQ